MAEEKKGTILTAFSTASATGKTLLSINMASELARLGAKVCLVDLDLQFGDVCNYLQLNPEKTIADAQKGIEAQGENFPSEELTISYGFNGIIFSVLPSPLRLDEAYNMSDKAVKTILHKLQKSFDYVVVDTTSTFSVINLMLLDESTIVSFLGVVDFIPTIKNMKIGIDTLRTLNYDSNKLRFVLNRSDAKTHISLKDVEKLLGSRFDYILPNDFHAASISIKTGVPMVLEDENTMLGQGLKELVAQYTNRKYAPVQQQIVTEEEYQEPEPEKKKGGGWFSRLFG